MYQALMSDRHDFVKIFLEQGFSLEEFLTVYMLERLYTDQLKSMVIICLKIGGNSFILEFKSCDFQQDVGVL